MGWWSNLFSPSSGVSSSSRRAQAMSSTRDAFSSSPTFHELDADGSFDPESASTPAFTYPPNSRSGAYDYVPTTANNWGTRRQKSPILPLHNQSHAQPSRDPSIARTWIRIRNWLENEYPELGDTLNYGILPQTLAEVEMQFGFPLPQAVRDSYLIVDGQEAESSAGCSQGLFLGLHFLPLEEVLIEWRFWREVDQDPSTGANEGLRDIMQSIPPGWVQRAYSSRGWIPLVTDRTGNYLGVDLAPGEGGTAGQVIVFGRDFDTKVVLWRGEGADGWAQWLQSFAEELESGESFSMGGVSDTSDSSEDDVGYEGYFFDGAGGGSKGQGGGGEIGSNGMKLTGEYKGWSVLEAWADRSLKRWRDSGVNLEGTPLPDHLRPASGQLPPAPDTTRGVEVPIPIFSEDGTATTPTMYSAPIGKGPTRSAPNPVVMKDLPKIAVTKAPAPLPVELPTAYDIVPAPSPPDSRTSSLDYESGLASRRVNGEGDDEGTLMTETDGDFTLTTMRASARPNAYENGDPLSPRTADPMLVKGKDEGPTSPDYIGEGFSGMESSIPIQPTPSTPTLVVPPEIPADTDGDTTTTDTPAPAQSTHSEEAPPSELSS